MASRLQSGPGNGLTESAVAISDPTLERLPPHDIAAEEAVLGSIVLDDEALIRVMPILDSGDFFRERNRLIYESVVSVYDRGEKINLVTVGSELRDRGRLEQVGGSSYLAQVVAETPTSLHAEYYALIVHRTSLQRRLISAGGQIASLGYNSGSDIEIALAEAESLIFSIRSAQVSRDFIHLRDILDRHFEETINRPADDLSSTGVPTGFIDLDRILGGLKRSDLVILAARPGLGKSSFAMNIAQNAALKQRSTVAVFSLEMTGEQIAQRLLAGQAGVDSSRLRLDLLSEDEQHRVMESAGLLSELNIYINDTPMIRVSEMRSKARRLHAEHPLDLIVIDYLQLIHGNGGENRVQEISEISRSLKGLARELNVPVLALSQLSRAVESRSPHIPMLSDLRESGSIEQDADIVLFIYREDVYYTEKEWERRFPTKPYPRGIADIIIAKHRNGPTGQISLLFFEKMTKFVNLNAHHG